jgi:hypothetical protein
MDLNYYQTLIAVADDCPVTESVVPVRRGAKVTVAVLQYDMIAANPHVHTQEDVLFQTWLQRQEKMKDLSAEEIAQLREEFFARPQPCLRASPLPKRYGWGLLFDQEGRVALCPMETTAYKEIASGERGDIKVLRAFRSKRA